MIANNKIGGKSSLINKRAQVSIFVIVALIIVAGIMIYFIARGGVGIEKIPAEFQPVYDLYSECIAEETQEAIDLAGVQGGRIFVDDYVPGSDYAPTGNQLNFLGFGVPYWYYITGNGLVDEQMPSRTEMENEIAEFVQLRVNENCDFDKYYSEGFWIDLGEAEAEVSVSDEKVDVVVNAKIGVTRGTESAVKSKHEVSVDSKLGTFYDTAKDIYDEEKDSAFLEEYAVDVMRLYAPVDGVEISCSGKIWKTREVVEDLKNGLEANMGRIKVDGNYYSLGDKDMEYYVVEEVGSDENVNFLYSKSWPSKVEIAGADDELMIATPIGAQQGLGTLGFCYAPYHFVYDLTFPIVVQIYNNNEMFQFPVVVVVDKNLPREGEFFERASGEDLELCRYANNDLEVRLYDINLNSVEGSVSYNCFNQECNVGETENGFVKGKVPACLNGYVGVRADGFAEKKVLLSSNEESRADVILDREYNVDIELEVDGKALSGTAIVLFTDADGKSTTGVLPDKPSVKLAEGLYNITVYVYGSSALKIPAEKKTQCTDVARGGVLGFFGGTREECFEITIPETKIESALIGGGKGSQYIFENDLAEGKIVLSVDGLPIPKTLEDLQMNMEAFEGNKVNVFYG